jgi:hypothetical protein
MALPETGPLGKILIVSGIALVIAGLLFSFGGKLFNLGRLPGDIFIKREGVSFYCPIVTCIVISIILTLVLNLFTRK